MVVGEVLAWLGAPGQIVALVMGGLALYHFRDIFAVLSTVGFATRVLAVGAFAAFAVVVLVPGVSVSIAVGTVLDFAARIWSVATSIGGAML
jgi:hypothetical protein